MIKRLCVFIILYVLMLAGSVHQADAQAVRSESIAVVVNEDAISWSDVQARMKLIIVSSGMPYNDEIREKMKPQILTLLIEEQLKTQEAKRLGIQITEEEIDQGFSTIAQQNNFSNDQFAAVLKESGIASRTIEDQIRAQIAWTRVVQGHLGPQVKISEADVTAVRERLISNIGKTEYLLSEIFLPVDDPDNDANVKSVANKILRQLSGNKASFQTLASQFSQSAGAASGGDLGWMQEGQLQNELEQQVAAMSKGDFSKAIRTLSGYHILLLRGQREISEETIPDDEVIGMQIGTMKLDRLQRRYLQDLKSAAFIEHRV